MTARRHALICCASLCCASLLVAGCSSLGSAPTFDNPKLKNLTIAVTFDPPPDEDGLVVRDTIIHIGFDDYPDPDTVTFGPLLLRSGTSSFDVEMKVDLAGKQVTVKPRTPLAADTQYEMVIGSQVAALSGRTVGNTVVAPLAVGEDMNPSPSPAPVPLTWVDDIAPILSGCGPFCHTCDRCSPATNKRHPTSSLNLTLDPRDPMYGLINVASIELAGSDRPLMRVAPGDSARSVLLRKILGGDPHADSDDPPTDNLGVPGRRMPLDEAACSGGEVEPYRTDDQIQKVEAWIDQGAAVGDFTPSTSMCPPVSNN